MKSELQPPSGVSLKMLATSIAFQVGVKANEAGELVVYGEAIGTGTFLRCAVSAPYRPQAEAECLGELMLHLTLLACERITLEGGGPLSPTPAPTSNE